MAEKQAEVVVAIDGSDNSHRALIAAADLADAMGRDLGLLYVYPNPSDSKQKPGNGSTDKASSQQQSESRAIFCAALAELGSRIRPAREYLLVGDPAAEIIDFMSANSNCHLVMGRRGLSRIKALMMGSVSDKVTRYSKGLVTVVS